MTYVKIPRRVFIDSDPVFTQLAIAKAEGYVDFFKGFDHLFTFGANIGYAGERHTTGGFTWHKTWQPVVTELWHSDAPPVRDRFTTVMTWKIESFTDVDGNKDKEFTSSTCHGGRRTASSWRSTALSAARARLGHGERDGRVEIALGLPHLHPGLARRVRGGQARLRGQLFGLVQRPTECYLAATSGTVQDTGWSAHLPTGAYCCGSRTARRRSTGSIGSSAIGRCIRSGPRRSLVSTLTQARCCRDSSRSPAHDPPAANRAGWSGCDVDPAVGLELRRVIHVAVNGGAGCARAPRDAVRHRHVAHLGRTARDACQGAARTSQHGRGNSVSCSTYPPRSNGRRNSTSSTTRRCRGRCRCR